MTHEDRANKLFPFDVYCDVIPHSKHVFCQADDKMYTLQQLNGEVMRKDIASALAEAENKGREGKIPSSTCYLRGWNEAIEAARKVAEGMGNIACVDCCEDIADSINKLKRW